jgi:hypothetical protein
LIKQPRPDPRSELRKRSKRSWPRKRTPAVLPTLRGRNQAFALGLFTGGLTRPSDSFRFLTILALGGLFICLAALHFTKDAFALHFLLKDFERLVDIVVANEYLQMLSNRAVPP